MMEGKKPGVIVVDELLTAGMKGCKECYYSHHLDDSACVAACNCCDGMEFFKPINPNRCKSYEEYIASFVILSVNFCKHKPSYPAKEKDGVCKMTGRECHPAHCPLMDEAFKNKKNAQWHNFFTRKGGKA